MTPLQNHIIISPIPLPQKVNGLFTGVAERPAAQEATVLQVSKGVTLEPGDTIVFLSNMGKWQDGNCIVNMDYVQAKI